MGELLAENDINWLGALGVYSMVEESMSEKKLVEVLTILKQKVSRLEALETEYGKLIDKLKETQKYSQNIIDSSIDMIIAVDKNRRIIEFNKAAEITFGYTRDEILGKHIQILYEDPQKGFEINKNVNQTGSSISEVSNRRKNGEIFQSLVSSSVLYDLNGEFIGVMGISRDITEQKKTERELENYRIHLEEMVKERTSELTKVNESLRKEILKREWAEEALADEKERLEVTLRSIFEGVIVTNTTGHIIMMNEVAESLTGWTEREAIGESIYKIYSVIDEKTGEACESPIYKALETGHSFEIANGIILIDKNGTERNISNGSSPIYNKEGKIIGGVLVFRDITENLRMQEEILKIEKLRSLEVLSGGIAHDFNNLLAAILGNISLAKMVYDKPDTSVFERLTEAEKASLRAKNLTQQLLTFSKCGQPVLRKTSIKEVLMDSVSFVLTKSKVKCEFSIPDDLWQAVIDEEQIIQVINNIIINADQAMPEGGIIKIKVENVNIDEDEQIPLEEGKYLKISISDVGIGISDDNLGKIFDPYFTTKNKGNGLGLATSYSIIKSHKGYISVESQLGKGSTFYIYLPASSEEIRQKELQINPSPAFKGKILVMDDEDIVRETICEMLENLGYTAIGANDGSEAIELYKNAQKLDQPFNMAIIDLVVPEGMGGEETIKNLLKLNSDIKAIVSSGNSNNPIMTEFEKYGFKDAIAKPYRIKDLDNKLSKLSA